MSTVASLPQQDNTAARHAYLVKKREEYAYQYSYNETFATVIKVPSEQKPDCGYTFALLANLAPQLLAILKAKLQSLMGCPMQRYGDYLFFGRASFPDSRVLDNFLSDEYFGLQRVIGVNHIILQGASADNPLPTKLALERIKQNFAQIVPNDTFDEALQNQRLYFTDYAMLQGLVDNPGEYAGRIQYVTAPIVLLYCQADGTLKPIAIQLNQEPSDSNPVFMPLDPAWAAAKFHAQIADINFQEFVSHATRIHYVVESFIIATYTQLYKTHPVFLLLEPNLRYTLNINAQHLFLKKPDEPSGKPGYFGKALAGDYDSMVALMAEAFKTYDFEANILPEDIKQRGVDHAELYYPYATEGKQIWDMTLQFVRDYLVLYYSDAQKLTEDTEIQNWARTMASEDGMRIKGFPNKFETVEDLALAVAHIMFTTTAKHSSIHYPQYRFPGYPPAMSFAAYTAPPTQLDATFTSEDLLQALPPRDAAYDQAFTFYLTNFRYGKMGEHKDLEPKAQAVVDQYQQQLAELAKQLTEAELASHYPYIYLNPKHIPNSVMV